MRQRREHPDLWDNPAGEDGNLLVLGRSPLYLGPPLYQITLFNASPPNPERPDLVGTQFNAPLNSGQV